MRLPDYLRQVGKNIREARIEAGLRQIDVQEKVGITYRHYQSIEAGRVNVTVETLCRLSRVFRCSPKDLVCDC